MQQSRNGGQFLVALVLIAFAPVPRHDSTF
jgi:hypothetical protein